VACGGHLIEMKLWNSIKSLSLKLPLAIKFQVDVLNIDFIVDVTGKFACNNSSLYRKQTCWKDLKSEAARTKIKDYNQSKLIISQLTWLKTVILGH